MALAGLTSPPHGWGGRTYSRARKTRSVRPSLTTIGPTQNTMKTYTHFGQLTFGDTSTSSAEDFPASHSARPDGERALKMTATSSRRLAELLRKRGRSGSFLKTLLACSPFSNPIVYLKWRSKRLSFFVRTVNSLQQAPSSDSSDGLSEASFQKSGQQDMYFRDLKMAHQSFCVFRLLPLVLHTNGIGYGLLPTPTATEISNQKLTVQQVKDGRLLKDRKKENGNGGQVSLTDFLVYHTLLALSTAPQEMEETMPSPIQKRQLRVLPTTEQIKGTKFPAGRAGQLNPRFVAEMMGFPKDWTELPFRHGAPKA
nr:hypothetical protein [Sphingobacterium arenae]